MPESGEEFRSHESAFDSADILRLRVAKIALTFILVILAIVGTRTGPFPLVSWPMFSNKHVPFPVDRVSEYEFRATTVEGEIEVLNILTFYPYGRESVTKKIIHEAFESEDISGREAHQRALRAMVARALPDREVASFEVWRFTWEVDPVGTPPLIRENPLSTTLVGRLEMSHGD